MHVCNAGQESRPGKYLSGDKLSHADLAVFCQLSALHCGWLDGEQRDWPELWGVIRAWACPMGQSISTCQLLMPGSREVFMLSNCSVLHMVSHQQEPGSSNQGVFGSASMQQQCQLLLGDTCLSSAMPLNSSGSSRSRSAAEGHATHLHQHSLLHKLQVSLLTCWSPTRC